MAISVPTDLTVMSNVLPLPAGPRWRVLVAHERAMVRHAFRTLIEAEDVAVVEAAAGEAALTELGRRRFDVLVLQLDLPEYDGATVIQMYRVLMAQRQDNAYEPPDLLMTLSSEVRHQRVVLDHLRSLGVAHFIDDEPKAEVAALIDMILRDRISRRGKSSNAAA